jgi:hypothetical protein
LSEGLSAGWPAGWLFNGDIILVEELGWYRPTCADLEKAAKGGLVVGLIRNLIGGMVVVLVVRLLSSNINLIEDFGWHRLARADFETIVKSGLFVGLFIWLGSGLLGWYQKILVPTPSRMRERPSQGLIRSGRNALIGMLFFGLPYMLLFGLSGRLGFGLAGGLFIGLAGGLSRYGGNSYIRHHLLRWRLSREGLLPFRLQPFLETMTGRILLHRTGPSYRFIHRTLQEHFTALTEADIDQLAQEIESSP